MRYAAVPAKELQPVLGVIPKDGAIPKDWMTEADLTNVKDADGAVVADCVFVDTDTGLVVIRNPSPAPGEFPLRAFSRKPPLTVEGAE